MNEKHYCLISNFLKYHIYIDINLKYFKLIKVSFSISVMLKI